MIAEEQIKAWIHAHQAEMVEAMKALIRIRSVGEGFHSEERQPFGRGCALAVDEARRIIEQAGLMTGHHDYYGISAVYPGRKEKAITFFSHLDVVPEGSGWSFDPYDPFERDGYLYGRGSSDNKAAAIGVIYTLKFLKDHQLPLKHTISAFLGCDEEAEMRDIAYYLKQTGEPAFGLVSDAFFPVGHGEKGILTAELAIDVAGSNLLSFEAGEMSNVVPLTAQAEIGGFSFDEVQAAFASLGPGFTVASTKRGVAVAAHGKGGHAAFPEGTVNPILLLAQALLSHGLVTGKAWFALAFIATAFADYYGTGLDIDYEDERSGKTTCIAGIVRLEGGRAGPEHQHSLCGIGRSAGHRRKAGVHKPVLWL